MKNENTYSIGLDIGTSSIGWSILDFDNQKIIKLGVRKFSQPIVPKSGATNTEARRKFRGVRRNIRRKRLRNELLMKTFVREGLISHNQYVHSRNNANQKENIFFAEKSILQKSAWQLRAEGLERKLSEIEWARVLFHLTKHRGYQSNAIEKKKVKENKIESQSETSLLLHGIANMDEKMKHYMSQFPDTSHTIGEMIYKTFDKKRNTTGDYSHTVSREAIEQELKILFEKQDKFKNLHVNKIFYKKIEEILNARRSFADGPEKGPYSGGLIAKMVGNCTLDPEELRAPKDSVSAVNFRLYSMLLNLRMGNYASKYVPLSKEQIDIAFKTICARAKVTYKQLRSILKLEDTKVFKGLQYSILYRDINRILYNKDEKDKAFYKKYVQGKKDIIPEISTILNSTMAISEKDKKDYLQKMNVPTKIIDALISASKNPEEKVFFDRGKLYEIEKTLSSHKVEYDKQKKNNICTILAMYRDDTAYKKLVDIDIPEILAENLALISISGFMHLSLKALDNILPYLLEGLDYDKACGKAGYTHTVAKNIIDNISNPTVKRAFSQIQKVFKDLVRIYGSPKNVFIEVARDLSKSEKERRQLQRKMTGNEVERKNSLDHFKQEFGRAPWGREAEVWRLYKEQDCKCLYCGKPFDIRTMFLSSGNPFAEIEHTLPFSRSHDNRQCNKTLACTTCNRDKAHQTPFEMFGSNADNPAWQEFAQRCKAIIKDSQKLDVLLTEEWNSEEYSERQLNDTRYISRTIQQWLEKEYEHLVGTPKKGEKRTIISIKGGATAVLRKVWQLERFKYNDDHLRESEKNHALDAAVVCAASYRHLQLISNANSKNELYGNDKKEKDPKQKEISPKEYRIDKQIQKILPPPWSSYIEELKAFLSDDPMSELSLINGAKEKYNLIDNTVDPIFISWMPNRSVKGEAHGPNPYSIRTYVDIDEKTQEAQKIEMYSKRTPIKNVNLKKLDKMLGRFDHTNKETPLYLALKAQLEKYGDKPELAFAEDFYKPSKPNKKAPKVTHIHITENRGSGVKILNGIADNGSMVRIDIFRRSKETRKKTIKDKKNTFFIIPIYTKHRVEETLPLRAIKSNTNEADWDEVAPEEFICSIYPNDYISILYKTGIIKEGYYVKTHRRNASISLHAHDTQNDFEASIKTNVVDFIKYHVDVLGNKYPVALPEKRMPLSHPKQNG